MGLGSRLAGDRNRNVLGPALCGVVGNEEAEKTTARGAGRVPHPEFVKSTSEDLKAFIKRVVCDVWRGRGEATPVENKLRAIAPVFSPWVYPPSLPRRQQVVLCTLRGGGPCALPTDT